MTEEIKARIEAVRRGEVPEGYSESIAGILPNDWTAKPLSEISDVLSEQAGDGDYETLSISAGIGFVNQAEKFGKELSGKQYAKYTVLRRGDFAYNKGNSKRYPQGCTYMLREREEAAVPNVFECFRIKEGYPEYYEQLFINGFMNRQLTRKINHGVRDDGLLNLTDDDFYSTILPIPPLAEQQKIAEILSTCDRVIELKQQLLDEKRKQKQWLMQMLLDPDSGLRLPGFSQEWCTVKLGDICTIKTGKLDANAASEHGKYPFFTCSRDIYWIDTYSFDGDAILIAGNGDVGHTKLYSGKFDAYQRTYVLMNFGDLDYRLIKQYIDFTLLPVVYTELQGGAMPYIKLSTLTQLSFSVPVSTKECESITKVLLSADNEIDVLEQELEAWQQKKKALMQLLLTGLVRVNA